jgi:formylglycine-generating enzyme required for sulfatase activity
MTLPIEPSYPIANLSQILSRANLDLSPIELAEILWLAVQRGEIVVTEETSQQPSESIDLPPPIEPPPNIQPEAPEMPLQPQPEVNVDIVAEPPQSPPEAETVEPAPTPIPVKIPEAVALRNRREIAKVLRPLMRKVPSRNRQAIDEEATAIRIAEDKIWNPVVKPEPERWLELAIVIEVTNLFDVWHDSISEFQHLMERHGAFRDVRTWQLQTPENGEPQLFLQTATGLNRKPRNPKELLDAGGRRLVLFLSDCTSKAWRSGQIFPLLELWSRQNPVTIAQLLPERYWDRSALGLGYLVALRSQLPGAKSRDWTVSGLSPRRRQRLQGGLKFPVVTIQPHSLGEWARSMAATGEQQTVGIVLQPDAFEIDRVADSGAEPLTAKQLVQQFRGTASEKAQELADMMAVLPVNWSVLRLLQKNLMQKTEDSAEGTGALYLAEIFLSGLLSPIEKHAQNLKSTQQYNFVEGVRSVLLGGIPISEAREVGEEIATTMFQQLPADVQERVNADIARRWGQSWRYFEAFLLPDLPWGEDYAAEMLPFGQVHGEVLRRWGGDYAALAERLEQTRGSQSSQVIDEKQKEFYYELLEQQFDDLEERIADDFTELGYDYHFWLHSTEIDELNIDEVSSIEVDNVNIIEISEILAIDRDTASFKVLAEIIFSVEFTGFDHDGYIRDIHEDSEYPTINQLTPEQSIIVIVNVDTILPNDDNSELEIESIDLTVQELISLDYENVVPSKFDELENQNLEIEWQEIEFEVVTVEFSEDYPSLEIFNFEVATLTVSQLELEDVFRIANEAIESRTGKELTAHQQEIIEGTWKNWSYAQIADTERLSTSYFRDVGAALFRSLSEELRKPISKTNMVKVFSELIKGKQQEMEIERSPGQAYQFVELLNNRVVLEMVQIPAGEFMMGAPENEAGSSGLERPQHLVNVPKFYLGKYPITQEQWRFGASLPKIDLELKPDPSSYKGTNLPVGSISWDDAIEFCARLSHHTKREYRLPSEAEWEYACRAGTNSPFHFGETITTDLANYSGDNAYGRGSKGIYRGKTTPVDMFPPNAFGLYDLHGNVWEWCLDHDRGDYTKAPTDGSAALIEHPAHNAHRIARGGNFYFQAHQCRSASRYGLYSDYGDFKTGFRIAYSAGSTR